MAFIWVIVGNFPVSGRKTIRVFYAVLGWRNGGLQKNNSSSLLIPADCCKSKHFKQRRRWPWCYLRFCPVYSSFKPVYLLANRADAPEYDMFQLSLVFSRFPSLSKISFFPAAHLSPVPRGELDTACGSAEPHSDANLTPSAFLPHRVLAWDAFLSLAGIKHVRLNTDH